MLTTPCGCRTITEPPSTSGSFASMTSRQYSSLSQLSRTSSIDSLRVLPISWVISFASSSFFSPRCRTASRTSSARCASGTDAHLSCAALAAATAASTSLLVDTFTFWMSSPVAGFRFSMKPPLITTPCTISSRFCSSAAATCACDERGCGCDFFPDGDDEIKLPPNESMWEPREAGRASKPGPPHPSTNHNSLIQTI